MHESEPQHKMASSGSDNEQNVLEVSKVEGHESEEEQAKMETYCNEYLDDECSDGSNKSTGSAVDEHWSHHPGAVRGGGDADTNYDTDCSTDTIVVERPERKTRHRAEFGARHIQQWVQNVKESDCMALQNEKKKAAEALFHEWLGNENDRNTQEPQTPCPVPREADGGQK